jgi:hypothetical protein
MIQNILTIFEDSFLYGHPMRQLCEGQGIVMLSPEATEMVRTQLFGQNIEIFVE